MRRVNEKRAQFKVDNYSLGGSRSQLFSSRGATRLHDTKTMIETDGNTPWKIMLCGLNQLTTRMLTLQKNFNIPIVNETLKLGSGAWYSNAFEVI
jgi:hypothetical protein